MILNTLLLACVGMTLEVVFTAATGWRASGNWRLMGYTYVWMAPIYALVYPLLSVIYPFSSRYPVLARGLGYVAAIYVVEYASGWALRKLTGECPWEHGYRGSRWSVHDLIRLDYAPAWFAASMIFERVYRALAGAA